MIIGEQPSERRDRETLSDELRLKSQQWAELTSEPVEYLDQFSNVPCIIARAHWAIKRKPKCCYEPKAIVLVKDIERWKNANRMSCVR